MDGAPAGGGGGPAPFLLKTYDMVDDSATDEIVSWSSNNKSFVVWNPPEFARLLLPMYFKHNNFSSFIRQLNTYGFRKVDPERWEFANEEFLKDQKHLLKNIHRRKPVHSHSNPPGISADPERAAYEEEIDKLAREKAAMESEILRLKQKKSSAIPLLESLTQRINNMEMRQDSLLNFWEKASQDPGFIEHLTKKLEETDIHAYNKKRRLPQGDSSNPIAGDGSVDDHSSRPESGNIPPGDISNKLRLELSPAVSDIPLISGSTQSSNEDGARFSGGYSRDVQMRVGSLSFPPDTLELSDTGASFTLKMGSSLSLKAGGGSESPKPDEQSLAHEEGDDSCHLNLSLASLPLTNSQSSAWIPQPSQEPNVRVFPTDVVTSADSDAAAVLSSLQEAPIKNQGPSAAPPVRVNDVFWEQFLTERPGPSDTEEASSGFRPFSYDDQEDGRGRQAASKNLEHLTL